MPSRMLLPAKAGYSAAGDSAPSPYCEQRDGIVQYGSYSLDFGHNSLGYSLPYLDPQYDYEAQLVVYHEGRTRWTQHVKLDDSLCAVLNIDPGVAETLSVQIPVASYCRGDAEALLDALRLRGQYSIMCDFTVRQCEPRRKRQNGQGGGGQAGAIMPLTAVLARPAPNPFSQKVTLKFSLNRGGHVSLKVYDASGRLMQALVDAECPAGMQTVLWDGRDRRGTRVPSGVYFVKLEAGRVAKVQKLVLNR